jgi:hypothetical protein
MNLLLRYSAVLPLMALGCATSFQSEVTFLQRHTETLVLVERNGPARVAVCPDLQGRVMTSSAAGPGGQSFGWINHALLEAHQLQPHMNVYGGEDRFWVGPEGGQFSLFFAKGVPQDLEHWFTPAPVDAEPWVEAARAEDRVSFRKTMELTNASGTKFSVEAFREVRLLAAADGWKNLALAPDSEDLVHMVAFESVNRITNAGKNEWTRQTGAVSIWILGMLNPSPGTTVVIPFRKGAEAALGPVVNDSYFGKVPADRLKVGEGVLFFRGDGQQRSKIGLSPRRSRPILGSWDAENGVLTIVQFTLSEENLYVNSMWETQKDPFSGDAVNSYNDGPPAPGKKPLGPFYELESSSPAAALKPGGSLRHVHRTFHLIGPRAKLDVIAKSTLGAGLDEIESAFAK